IRDPEGDHVRVGRPARSEEAGDHLLAHEAEDAAQKRRGSHRASRADQIGIAGGPGGRPGACVRAHAGKNLATHLSIPSSILDRNGVASRLKLPSRRSVPSSQKSVALNIEDFTRTWFFAGSFSTSNLPTFDFSMKRAISFDTTP